MKPKNEIINIKTVRMRSRGFERLAAVLLTFALAAFFISTPVTASPIGAGWISTDRLGYNGTITRYSDADLTQKVGDVIQTGPRDLALRGTSNASLDDRAIVMGSWWYSTAVDSNGIPRGNGWGNTTGNTGPGFMQYFNSSSAFDPDQIEETRYDFDNFDGTHWTEFSYFLEVKDGEASSRLSAPSNTGDGGIYRSLVVDLTVSGLEGQLSGDWIIANNQPTAVTGSIKGVFENTSTTTANNGFYAFDFSLNMDNWAWTNSADLVGIQFSDSFFGARPSAIPEPGTLAMLGLGLAGLGFMRRRRT